VRMSLCLLLATMTLTACNAGAQTSSNPRPLPAPPGMSGSITFDAHILVDQFGYLPGDPKVAVIRTPHAGFDQHDQFKPGKHYEVRRASDGSVVFSGGLSAWNGGAVEKDSGDSGWWFDFTKLDTPDTYFVYDADRKLRSATFRIDPHVYRDVLKAAMRMYFYQRAGFAKQQPQADACWADGPAFLGQDQDSQAHDVTARGDASKVRNLSGGWFDAGDTNKYVTLAATPVHQLLQAYQTNPGAFTDDFNIPESGNGVPDVLDEVRWELDWLQRMQFDNGSVALKVGELGYGVPGAPSHDLTPRYYVPACTSATIAAAGMYAHGAYVFDKVPALKEDALSLRKRAVAAWKNFQETPKQIHCDSGAVKAGLADLSEVDQASLAVVAAVYLYAVTGEAAYGDYLKAHYRDTRPYRDTGWTRYNPEQGEALLFYTGLPDADSKLRQQLLEDKANDMVAGVQTYTFAPDLDLYRAFMHEPQYHWGSNQPRANYGNTNLDVLVYQLPAASKNASTYRTRAEEILHYFHGVNPLGMVYLSNMYQYGATRSANEIYHIWYWQGTRWSDALTSACGPAPGYVPGGPNAVAMQMGVPASVVPPIGQPQQKSYKDWNSSEQASYTVTEPGIYYQSAYVQLLSYFVK
jgi:endoglucanase